MDLLVRALAGTGTALATELVPQAFARGGRRLAVAGTVAGGLLMVALALTVGV
jgi:hypothetical protein